MYPPIHHIIVVAATSRISNEPLCNSTHTAYVMFLQYVDQIKTDWQNLKMPSVYILALYCMQVGHGNFQPTESLLEVADKDIRGGECLKRSFGLHN